MSDIEIGRALAVRERIVERLLGLHNADIGNGYRLVVERSDYAPGFLARTFKRHHDGIVFEVSLDFKGRKTPLHEVHIWNEGYDGHYSWFVEGNAYSPSRSFRCGGAYEDAEDCEIRKLFDLIARKAKWRAEKFSLTDHKMVVKPSGDGSKGEAEVKPKGSSEFTP